MQQPSAKPSHSKSRTGCLRCKAKKTKCDERKPACARCEDRGFQCPGYALDVRWSHKHQTFRDGAPTPPRSWPRNSGRVTQRNTAPTTTTVGANQGAGAMSPLCFGPPAEQVQRLDSWQSTSPSQWDFIMPQEMMFDLGEANHSANLLPTQDHENPFTLLVGGAADFMSGAWTVENDSSPSNNSIEELAVEGNVLTAMNGAVAENATEGEMQLQQARKLQPRSRPGMVLQEARTGCFPNTPREIFNLPTALSEYFFREVITLYCAFDSKTNIMRNIIENLWQSSGALHHTIQSMAAACLSEDFPHLQSVARNEHVQALEFLHKHKSSSSLASKNAMLLALQLLGHTSSWLAPQNLATEIFRDSCTMLNDISSEVDSEGDANISFFSEAMEYWAMLLAYLTDSTQLGNFRRNAAPVSPAGPAQTAVPHPYTGISYEMVRILTDTGILIFQYRKHMASVKFMTENDLDVFKQALKEARRLERVLLSNKTPDVSHFKDPGDPKTPLRHLQLIDEVYRCTGLLQLYRVFPDLLNERYAPWDKDQLLRPIPAEGDPPTQRERQTWLTKLAMHILSILREIPFESHTRSAQPFVMVAVSSELRRDPLHLAQQQQQQEHGSGTDSAAAALDQAGGIPIDKTSIEVARARKFLGSRLAAYTHILPLRKSRVIFELINNVWSAMDAGQQDVYWLDVAYEKGLGTMMG